MVSSLPVTIPELLEVRARNSPGSIHFLDDSGSVASSITVQELFFKAQAVAKALLSHGLKGGGEDIVITNFQDQKDHILLFWGCCFGKILIHDELPRC